MENILRSFFDTADTAELAVFDRELAHITQTCTADDTELILSRALEKAGMKPKPAKTKKHKRRRLFILIAAAVIVLSAVGFTVFFDKLDVYFGISDKGSPFVGIFNERSTSVSNDDLTLSIDGAFIDDMRAHFMISLTAKNREGRKIIDAIERSFGLSKSYHGQDEKTFMKYYGDIDLMALWQSGSRHQMGFLYTQGTHEQVKFDVFGTHYFGYNTASAFYFEATFHIGEEFGVDVSKPMIITEYISGLTVEADLTPNVETVKLVSDDPNAYTNATVSPLGVHIVSPEDDPYIANKVITDPPDTVSDSSPVVIFVHKKDGTVVEAPNAQGIQIMGEPGKKEPDRVDAYANLWDITMIDDIDHVTILGIDYRLER